MATKKLRPKTATKKTTSRRSVIPLRPEKMPLGVWRSGIILQRVHGVLDAVAAIRQGPLTRTRFKNYMEALIGTAACRFCQYLYAAANGKRAQAARHWDEVQGMVEYEISLGLLLPVKKLKKWSSREKAVQEVLPIIKAELVGHTKWVERQYAESGRKSPEGSYEWQAFHLTKPLVRPTKSLFQEFFTWVDWVMTDTFGHEEMMLEVRSAKEQRLKG